MGLMPTQHIRSAYPLVTPNPVVVANLQPIRSEVTPSHLSRRRLLTSTIAYLYRNRFTDQRLLSLCPRGALTPDGPYQAHLCLHWDHILFHYNVRAITPDEDFIKMRDINNDAVLREGDPDFDPFCLLLDEGDGDY